MSEERDPLGVHIGAREIYDEVVGLRGDVQRIGQTEANITETLDDHETRIRGVERWVYAIPVATVGGVIAAVVAFIKGG